MTGQGREFIKKVQYYLPRRLCRRHRHKDAGNLSTGFLGKWSACHASLRSSPTSTSTPQPRRSGQAVHGA